MGSAPRGEGERKHAPGAEEAGAEQTRRFDAQPLDAVLRALGLDNHDVVTASAAPLTHKMVQKGRRGRPLTRRIQMRIVNAVNARAAPRVYTLDELFTYRGRL